MPHLELSEIGLVVIFERIIDETIQVFNLNGKFVRKARSTAVSPGAPFLDDHAQWLGAAPQIALFAVN